MGALVFVLPLMIFIFKGKNNIGWMVAASVMVNIGMWLERYIVIVPSEVWPRFLHEFGQGAYLPTWTELLITLACFAGMFLLYALFTRYFPIIPLWETAEIPHIETAAASTEALPAHAERGTYGD